jgi:hypothetical protein
LIDLCQQKIDEFEQKRGDSVWSHRRRGHRPISGSVRYEVLSRAKGRCELCGISNEEKMLDYRLNYYKDIVDYFILIEATKTFSGLDKPLYFNRIKDKYSHLNIIHYIVDQFPADMTAWDREHYQRECIHKALLKVPKLRNDDWVHIADVDEISNRDKLETVISDDKYSHPERVGYTLHFDNYYYNLTSKMDQPCLATKLIRYGTLLSEDRQM